MNTPVSNAPKAKEVRHYNPYAVEGLEKAFKEALGDASMSDEKMWKSRLQKPQFIASLAAETVHGKYADVQQILNWGNKMGYNLNPNFSVMKELLAQTEHYTDKFGQMQYKITSLVDNAYDRFDTGSPGLSYYGIGELLANLAVATRSRRVPNMDHFVT